jgi:L-ascorbate metabolism protein UlaG (beta-lactamase superfamily)
MTVPSVPPLSDHFDGKRFFNPGVDIDKTWRDLRRWRQERRPTPWPRHVPTPAPLPHPDPVAEHCMAATYIGQATVLIQAGGVSLLTDPIFSMRAGPLSWLGPRRVRAPGVAFDRLPRIDIVLLSHNHYDHMDLPSLKRLARRDNPLIVTGLGNGRVLDRHDLRHWAELDWWQSYSLQPGIAVTFVPAQHWSRRHLFDRRRTLWGGHVVETPAGRLYFAGDTGYPASFRDIARRLGPPDLALLPIGAYEPRWFMATQHMNPDEAVRAHRDLGARRSLAIHFGTFPLADEGIDAPLEALDLARRLHHVPSQDFILPPFGETLVFPAPP